MSAVCESIMEDLHYVYPVSVFVPQFACYLGWPSVINRSGIFRLLPVSLCDNDFAKAKNSAISLKNALLEYEDI